MTKFKDLFESRMNKKEEKRAKDDFEGKSYEEFKKDLMSKGPVGSESKIQDKYEKYLMDLKKGK